MSDNITNIATNLDKTHIWHHLTQHKKFESSDPIVFVEGKGMRLRDTNGKEYLDAVSGGLWTVNVGYGRESIANAVRDQLIKMNFYSNAMGTIPAAEFAEKLIQKMPGMSRVYYSNSGSEANEKVYKMVRQISKIKHGGGKYKILYRERDYHGTTIANLASGGHPERVSQYGPFPPGFVEVPHCLEYRNQYGVDNNYGIRAADAIEEVILKEGPDTVGAIVLETITAGGGCILPPEGYWQRVQEICKKYNVLLHLDEVVCGFGRLGTWFGYQQFDIKPDFVTMAKGLASGYAAIACMVTTEEIFNFFKSTPDDPMSYFRDISTYGGCTGGTAAALANMAIIEEENLLDNCKKMGEYLLEQSNNLYAKHSIIGDVRGRGLFVGLELVVDRETKEPLPEIKVAAVQGHCMSNGVIIGGTNRSLPGYNNTLLFSPALIATKTDIDQIITAVDNALTDLFT